MDPSGELERHLRFLEEELLQPDIRGNAAALDALLCDDFVEFGSSGRIFDKRSIVVALGTETPGLYTISEFKLLTLGTDTALVRYQLSWRATPDAAPIESLRSSLWRNVRGEWKMAFHQGTRAAAAGTGEKLNAEMARLFTSMTAYTGRYTVEADRVIHHVEFAWNPAWKGTDQVRYITFDGDTIRIRTQVIVSIVDGRKRTFTLHLRRVK